VGCNNWCTRKERREFADRAGCPDAYLPGTQNGQATLNGEGPKAAEILEVLLEAERLCHSDLV